MLALVGIPLGLSSKKGGKSAALCSPSFWSCLLLAFPVRSLVRASQGKISPALGVWLADIVFLDCRRGPAMASRAPPDDLVARRSFQGMAQEIGASLVSVSRADRDRADNGATRRSSESIFRRLPKRWRLFNPRFPTLLDDYLLRDFGLSGHGRGRIPDVVPGIHRFRSAGRYSSQSDFAIRGRISAERHAYFMPTHSAAWHADGGTHHVRAMQRSNEITAIKATGTSIYRLIVPVLVASVLLAGVLFLFDQFYLPYTNKRQDALRSQIKGKPPQTYLRPDRKWIFGQHSDIYYYQFFDPDRDQFGSLSVFQFDPATFRITHRITAERAHWADPIALGLRPGMGAQRGPGYRQLPHVRCRGLSISEPPGYFKKEVRQSSEMNYQELRRYIHDLQQSGFDVVRLRVQLQKKLAYPIIASNGGARHSLRAFSRQARRRRGHCDRCRYCHCLLDGFRLAGGYGKHQPAAAGAGGLVPRPDFWPDRRISDTEDANLKTSGVIAGSGDRVS